MSVTVKVVWPQDGKPYENARVWVSIDGGRTTETQYTDGYGYVNFEDCSPGYGKININGDIVFRGQVPPTITLQSP